jgi:hypothetical protein
MNDKFFMSGKSLYIFSKFIHGNKRTNFDALEKPNYYVGVNWHNASYIHVDKEGNDKKFNTIIKKLEEEGSLKGKLDFEVEEPEKGYQYASIISFFIKNTNTIVFKLVCNGEGVGHADDFYSVLSKLYKPSSAVEHKVEQPKQIYIQVAAPKESVSKLQDLENKKKDIQTHIDFFNEQIKNEDIKSEELRAKILSAIDKANVYFSDLDSQIEKEKQSLIDREREEQEKIQQEREERKRVEEKKKQDLIMERLEKFEEFTKVVDGCAWSSVV